MQVIVRDGWEFIDQGQQKKFRKGEFEIVLRNLGSVKSESRDPDGLIDWALTEIDYDRNRRNPHRYLFVRDAEEVLALHTTRMAFADTLQAFDAIRQSVHFVSERR